MFEIAKFNDVYKCLFTSYIFFLLCTLSYLFCRLRRDPICGMGIFKKMFLQKIIAGNRTPESLIILTVCVIVTIQPLRPSNIALVEATKHIYANKIVACTSTVFSLYCEHSFESVQQDINI